MEKAAISLASPAHYGVLPASCSLLTAPAFSAGGAISSLGGSSRGTLNITGLMVSDRGQEWVERKVNCNGFNGSWGKLGSRFHSCKARGIGGGGGGGSNFSFHKGILPPVRCHKMFVPGFGEKSPEAKAADSLHNFFTFVAVKIVLSQLQDYNREGYEDLMDFVDRVSLKDGDKFCATLMRESFRHKGLALRIMEVRSAYSRTDFEWDNLQKLCDRNMDAANTKLMREFLVETSEYKG